MELVRAHARVEVAGPRRHAVAARALGVGRARMTRLVARVPAQRHERLAHVTLRPVRLERDRAGRADLAPQRRGRRGPHRAGRAPLDAARVARVGQEPAALCERGRVHATPALALRLEHLPVRALDEAHPHGLTEARDTGVRPARVVQRTGRDQQRRVTQPRRGRHLHMVQRRAFRGGDGDRRRHAHRDVTSIGGAPARNSHVERERVLALHLGTLPEAVKEDRAEDGPQLVARGDLERCAVVHLAELARA